MIVITPEKRLQFTITGWPKPTDSERCSAVTLKGKRCNKRRARNAAYCQQHDRKAKP